MDRQDIENSQNTENSVQEDDLKPIEVFYAGRKKGIGRGILYGVVGTLLAGTLLFTGICKVAGVKLLVTGGNTSETNGTLLNSHTVQKINELKGYVDLYYYDDADTEA